MSELAIRTRHPGRSDRFLRPCARPGLASGGDLGRRLRHPRLRQLTDRSRTRVFEVDRARTQAQKAAVLDRLGINREGVTFVAADFAETARFDELVAAGLQPVIQICFLWVGSP